MAPAGKYDRRITFERPVITQGGAYNRKSTAWETVTPKAWAQVQDVLPSRAESVEDMLSMTRRPCKIRCRYREDITSDMRIDYRGRKLRIVSGPVEVGRRDELEMVAEEWSTEGEGV
jgi:SPP1 family predicted phage head-tail adaptor